MNWCRTCEQDADECSTMLCDVVKDVLYMQLVTCNCGQCGRIHTSDCAVHNEPAFPRGKCDCAEETTDGK